jgi:hypothetical protein
MTESIARAPEAAMDLAALALARIDTAAALIEQRAPAPDLVFATMGLLEIRKPFAAMEMSAQLLAALGRRRWQEGWRACEAHLAGLAAERAAVHGPPLRLVSGR